MTIAVMQPYFLPYIGYWQLMDAVDTFVILDDVSYIKRGYINRNFLLVNKEAKLFTLEVLQSSQNKLINEIFIGNNTHKILKTIEYNYKKAPFFNKVYSVLEDIFKNDEKNLVKFIHHSFEEIKKYLQLDTEFIYSSDLNKNNDLKSQDKIVDICKTLDADTYINPIGGTQLYQKKVFQRNGIKLNFLETEKIKYKQFDDKFMDNLSIVDILMFNSVVDIKKMLQHYRLN